MSQTGRIAVKVPAPRMSYRELLLAEVGRKRYSEITKSYDLLGNIAIIDADRELAKKIAAIIIKTHKNVETVLRKAGAVAGRYRIRKYAFVLGKRGYIARYNENGASFTFDVRKTFFSPRLAYERKRIVDLSKDGEKVVVMFAGVGPFAIEIAKKNRKSGVVAIELNKESYKYMLENIRINKVGNVMPVLADASRPPKGYANSADRIIMPLPADSYRFLGSAFRMAGDKCVIHYYTFSNDNGKAETAKLRRFAERRGRRFRLISKRVARPYSAKTSEMALDFEIVRKGYKP